MDLLKKSCIWCNQKVLSILKVLTKCAKLQQSIYGLVQASRSWNIRFDKLIKAYSFIQIYGEACIYKSEWEHYSLSDKYMWMTYCWSKIMYNFLESIKEYLKSVFQKKTSVKLLTYWASRSIEIDQDAWYIFNEYIPWQDFEVVQNRTFKEGVLACIARCKVE